jgi:hypothetical protein
LTTKATLTAAAIATTVLCGHARPSDAAAYLQTNLVSDITGLAALTEPELVNPWGLSHSPTSPIWTSNQHTVNAGEKMHRRAGVKMHHWWAHSAAHEALLSSSIIWPAFPSRPGITRPRRAA